MISAEQRLLTISKTQKIKIIERRLNEMREDRLHKVFWDFIEADWIYRNIHLKDKTDSVNLNLDRYLEALCLNTDPAKQEA